MMKCVSTWRINMGNRHDRYKNSGEELRQRIEEGLRKMRLREMSAEEKVARTRRFFEIPKEKEPK